VSNEGRDKLVVLYGDSHAHYTAFRFGKLYDDAKKQNRTHELPTFVALIFSGTTLTKWRSNYNFLQNWIKKHKPDRLMLTYLWLDYRNYHGFFDSSIKNYNHPKDEYFYENIGHFFEAVKSFTDQGI
jgi:hypothetical protein